jgi:hypothetical protein
MTKQNVLSQAEKMHNLKSTWKFKSEIKDFSSNNAPSPTQLRKLSRSTIHHAVGEINKSNEHNIRMQKAINSIKRSTKDKMYF